MELKPILEVEFLERQELVQRSLAKLDSLKIKWRAFKDTCSHQDDEILLLEQQLIAETKKSEMAFQDQQRIINQLKERLAEKELQVIEGEKSRKKLHNTIMELKENIRVLCRVRPLQHATVTDVISYLRL